MIDYFSLMRVLDGVIAIHGTQEKAAKTLGVTGAYLSDILHGRRAFSADFVQKLGYRKVVMYEQLPSFAVRERRAIAAQGATPSSGDDRRKE